MTMRKAAQRIPFKPSKTQALLLERCFGDRRFAYNQQVEAFNTYDKESNPKPSYPNVTDMKNANGWLRDSPHAIERVEQRHHGFSQSPIRLLS